MLTLTLAFFGGVAATLIILFLAYLWLVMRALRRPY